MNGTEWEEIKTIELRAWDVKKLLQTLQAHIDMQTAWIEQAEQDEAAGKETSPFNNYNDYIAALEATKDKAKEFMKIIQWQTGITETPEEALDKM